MANRNSEHKHLFRSRTDRFISGVCGGIADYFQIDGNIVRIIFIILGFTGGIGIILYIAGLIILPENPNEEESKTNKVSNSLIFGFILIAIGGFLLLRELGMFHYFRFFDFSLSTIWGLILIGIGIILLFQVKKQPVFADKEENIDSIQSEKKLYRSKSDKMLAGICGGLSKYFDIDSSIIRIGWVLATFFSVGIGVLVYIILIFVFPEEPTEQNE